MCPEIGPHPVSVRPLGSPRKWPWLGGLLFLSRSRKRERSPPSTAFSGRPLEEEEPGPAGSVLRSWTIPGARCNSRQGRPWKNNLRPCLQVRSLRRIVPSPVLTRTKTTTARRSRNSSPNGTGLPEASSTGSSATAAARGCQLSGPLGTGAGAAYPLTCRVTGASEGAAIAPYVRGPRESDQAGGGLGALDGRPAERKGRGHRGAELPGARLGAELRGLRCPRPVSGETSRVSF